jgi:hypothetical protein
LLSSMRWSFPVSAGCRVRGSVSTPKSAAWAFSAMSSAALLPFSRDHEQSGTKASEADVSRLACPVAHPVPPDQRKPAAAQPGSPAAPELISPPFCSCRRLETWPHRALLECARGTGRPVRRRVPGKRRLRGQPPRLAFSHDGWLAGGETSLVRTRPVRSWLRWLLMAVWTAAGRRPRCRPVVPADRRARGAGRRGPTRRAAPSRRPR